jgi:hypothetical protein
VLTKVFVDSFAAATDNGFVMPHRTVFQWGKNNAHPFTVFLGGFVIGGLVTAAVMYSWIVVDSMNDQFDTIIVEPVKSTETPAPAISPSASPDSQVQF